MKDRTSLDERGLRKKHRAWGAAGGAAQVGHIMVNCEKCAPCCTILSAAGAIFLFCISQMYKLEPEYVIEGYTAAGAAKASSNCREAAIVYCAFFCISLFVWCRSHPPRDVEVEMREKEKRLPSDIGETKALCNFNTAAGSSTF